MCSNTRADFIRRAVEELPGDGSVWEGEWEGYGLVLYRCAKLTSQPTGLGERLRVLTGGVQLWATTPRPSYGPHSAFDARLPAPWTEAQLARRIDTLLRRAEERAALDAMRDAVFHAYVKASGQEWFREEWEAEAWASGREPYPDDMSADECTAWLEWISQWDLTIVPG